MKRTSRLLQKEVESSAWATPQSNAIHRAIVADLKEKIKHLVVEWKVSKGHFYTSIFIRTRTGTIWNIFSGDYRWDKTITMRTATSMADYTGGSNISLGEIKDTTAGDIEYIIVKNG